VPRTVVAFTAHPDDEALLMGGTLARLAAQGHRVVLVTATDGGAGPAAAAHTDARLGSVRLRELRASALALGAARVVPLGYADSGLVRTTLADTATLDETARPRPLGPPAPLGPLGPLGPPKLTHADPAEVTDRLVRLLREEKADVLVSCDAAGGYGHPDHLVVHRVARAAAASAGTARLLEATAPREPLLRALRALDRCRFPFTNGFQPQDWAQAFSPAAQITYRVDVRPWIHHKRAALRAHASQASSEQGGDTRTLARVLRLPTPIFALLLGHEWFHDPGAQTPSSAGSPALDDGALDDGVLGDDVLAGL